jgi:alanine transaminase
MDNSNENDKTLTMKTINPRVIEVEYAVRGPIVIRAAEIEKQIKQVWILLLILFE